MGSKILIETPANIDKLKQIATLTNTLDKYVYLREDEQGRYIEYAFIDGAPTNNRCLSWYDKPHPIALERNGHDIDKWLRNVKPIDRIYKLNAFTCNNSCSVGKPNERCLKNVAPYWTFEEPIKCACWSLAFVMDSFTVDIKF